MNKLKLTPVQSHQLRTAYNNSAEVLQEIKRTALKGSALEDMKILETSVQNLEVLILKLKS